MQTLYLSRIKHYVYCPRRFALIELEQLWEDNQFTAEGQVVHERVVSGEREKRGEVTITRSLSLSHEALGLEGVADVVEYHQNPDGTVTPYPIEYKRGRPSDNRADEVQLMAQALCLEDMHNCHLEEGALFYGKTHRRKQVVFDDELREFTLSAIKACREIIETGTTPKPLYRVAKCRSCSLNTKCHPKIFNKNAETWFANKLAQTLDAEPVGDE